MSGTAMTPGVRARRSGRSVWTWLAEGIAALGRGLVFLMLTLAGLGPLLALALGFLYAWVAVRHLAGLRPQGPSLSHLGTLVPLLIFGSLLYLRKLVQLTRQLAGKWCGVSIARPYHPAPDGTGLSLREQVMQRLRWLVTDPASWRDLLWLVLNTGAGWLLIAVPAAMALYGLMFAALPAFGVPVAHISYVGFLVANGPAALPAGLALTAAALWAGPHLLPGYGWIARMTLGPSRQDELAVQVRRLTQTRTETIDAGAAELRRIERDLHDGAQARLVAMGMTLDAIEQQIDSSPAAARALVAEARESSVKALAELRDLVRGIHPPVLADRGLGEAVRALALDSPLPVRVSLELPGRPPAPVESAAYFAVCELLANVSKHAAARESWIDIRHSAGLLGISICDNGQGGAAASRGSGLRGIERRLAAFDGVLAISSPPGGPTVINMEIPCALSSPKTSSY